MQRKTSNNKTAANSKVQTTVICFQQNINKDVLHQPSYSKIRSSLKFDYLPKIPAVS